jgi:retron-type reverse transcriptase
MKRIGQLYPRVVEIGNAYEAAWRASQGKRQRRSVEDFLQDLGEEANRIVSDLDAGCFRFSGYQQFTVRDPKIRTIHAPAFRDRVVHHMMIQVLGPVFESGATDRSYACRRGKGQHAAIRRAAGWTRRAEWFLKLDVAKFYDSIPHGILRGKLAKRFREKRVLQLFDGLLASYQTRENTGLPIGALTSQYLGNFYLDAIDHSVLQSGLTTHYLRYMDDLFFFGDRAALLDVRLLVDESLADLGLRSKGVGILNRCREGVPFLGFVLYPDRIRLDRRGRKRLRMKWARLENDFLADRIDETALTARTGSLFAHARTADDVGWRREIVKFSRIRESLETDAPCPARRFVEQLRNELPLCDPQQEQGRQPQQEQRLPGLSVSRHGDTASPDDAASRARNAPAGALRDETTRQPSSGAEICAHDTEKAPEEAAGFCGRAGDEADEADEGGKEKSGGPA